jgi:5-methylcytosine-specific restriction protein B
MDNFDWTGFYIEFADKLLYFKNDRTSLLSVISDVHNSLGLKNPFIDNGVPLDDICPFTVFGSFNKGLTDNNRTALMRAFAQRMKIKADVPTNLAGIPVLNNMRAWFFVGKAERKDDDIPNLWELFESAIRFADAPSDVTKTRFTSYMIKPQTSRE